MRGPRIKPRSWVWSPSCGHGVSPHDLHEIRLEAPLLPPMRAGMTGQQDNLFDQQLDYRFPPVKPCRGPGFAQGRACAFKLRQLRRLGVAERCTSICKVGLGYALSDRKLLAGEEA